KCDALLERHERVANPEPRSNRELTNPVCESFIEEPELTFDQRSELISCSCVRLWAQTTRDARQTNFQQRRQRLLVPVADGQGKRSGRLPDVARAEHAGEGAADPASR